MTFRVRLNAAPLKQQLRRGQLTSIAIGAFRVRLNAAPLKLAYTSLIKLKVGQDFPRSIERGPIEADSGPFGEIFVADLCASLSAFD